MDTAIDHDMFDSADVHGTITVPATLEHLDDIYELIHRALSKEGCPMPVRNQLDVILEELFVNVCSYAYAKSQNVGDCRLDYLFRKNPPGVVIRIIDWGTPFDPLAHTDPESPTSIADAKIGGLGIMMVKRLTDRITYARTAGANVLTFKKDW